MIDTQDVEFVEQSAVLRPPCLTKVISLSKRVILYCEGIFLVVVEVGLGQAGYIVLATDYQNAVLINRQGLGETKRTKNLLIVDEYLDPFHFANFTIEV